MLKKIDKKEGLNSCYCVLLGDFLKFLYGYFGKSSELVFWYIDKSHAPDKFVLVYLDSKYDKTLFHLYNEFAQKSGFYQVLDVLPEFSFREVDSNFSDVLFKNKICLCKISN